MLFLFKFMPSLFINFNFSLKLVFLLNWVSLLTPILMMNSMFYTSGVWLTSSRMMKMISSISMFMFNDFKTSNMFKTLPLSGVSFIWLFTAILFFNFMGLCPYMFTPTSSLSLSMFMASTIMYLLDWAPLFTKNWQSSLLPPFTSNFLILGVVMIELISSLIRPLTLSVRLAANMVAGHLLIGLINGGSVILIPLISPLGMILMFLEMSVAIIQSYVFTSLSMMFFSSFNSLKLLLK